MAEWERVAEAARYLKQNGVETVDVGVVLGSGLGGFADSLKERARYPYTSIPHMPASSVIGHAGNLVSGSVGRVRVACLQGRVHLYEGHEPERVVFGVRLLAVLGARAVLLTNAAGGIKSGFVPGDLMLIRDHINLLGKNPLLGFNDEEKGPRFVDLTHAYDQRVCEAGLRAALDQGIELKEGVYAAMLGPSYETPAEIRMLRILGADAVGMSTVPEAIALNHLGIPVGAMSSITNFAAGIKDEPLSHEDVERVARENSDRFRRVLGRWIERTGDVLA